MHHRTAHAVPGTFLFHTWTEARALWLGLAALGPPEALVLLPDQVHLVAADIPSDRWHAALCGWALWRDRHRGWPPSPVWAPSPPPRPALNRLHLERTVRYVHLAPCRAGLCGDPLAWPFSTHRDAVGLALPAVRSPVPHPERFHRQVSSDPSVDIDGTPLPGGTAHADPWTVVEAVSALVRQPVLGWDAWTHDLAAAILRHTLGMSPRAVASWLPISPFRAIGLPKADPYAVARVLSVLGDPRFPALEDGDLSALPGWRLYPARQAQTPLLRFLPVWEGAG